MQLLSIKLVCLFIIFGGLQPTQLSALYEKFSEMLVLSSNSDYHPNQIFLFSKVFGTNTTMNFHDNKEVFWIHFSSQEYWSGFSSLVLWNLASNGVLWHLQYLNLFPPLFFFISGHDSHNWHNLRGIRTNFVTCYEYRYYTSAKYKRQINSILKFLVSLRANHPKCRQLMFKRCKWYWSNLTCTKRVLC